MIFLVEIFIFVFVLLIWWKIQDKKRYKGYPPGPPRIPLFGNLFQLATRSPFPALAFEDLSKTYGDVMFLNIGRWDAAVFSSYETVTEIYNLDKASCKGGHLIPIVNDRIMNKNIGLIWSNGDPWKIIRRFTIRTLREFGFGKTMSMDAVVNEELDKFVDHINKLVTSSSHKSENYKVHVDDFFDLTVINVLWRLVTGINYDLEDSRMLRLLRLSNEMVKGSNFAFDLSIAYPSFREWFPGVSGRTKQLQIRDDLFEFCKETIEEHRKSEVYKTHPQCFVDAFLSKIDENANDPSTEFNDDQLLLTILDLFQAGAETTSKTLTFGLLYMLLHQDIQQKVQDEIDAVVPKESPITMSMKSNMPYSHATLLEVLRFSTAVPFPPMRVACEDFFFRGYLIKKGTSLMTNSHAVHYSKSIWGDPNVFRPERFLTLDGTVDTKLEKFVIPFGGGPRMCLGQALAETSLFLYFTTVLRRFKFLKVPGKPDPSVVPLLGMTLSPQPFDVRILPRV